MRSTLTVRTPRAPMSSSAPRSGIRLTFWNCNGLSTYKVRQLTRFARVTEVAALALCETKRPESQLPDIRGFDAFGVCGERRSGGVALYTNVEYGSRSLTTTEVGSSSCCWSEMRIGRLAVVVGVFYIHPEATADDARTLLSTIGESLTRRGDLPHLLVGDFNARCEIGRASCRERV